MFSHPTQLSTQAQLSSAGIYLAKAQEYKELKWETREVLYNRIEQTRRVLLFVSMKKNPDIPTHSAEFLNQTLFSERRKVASPSFQ